MTNAPRNRRAILLCRLDAYANGVKPRALRAFLESRGYDVAMLSTHYLSRLGTGRYSRLLPGGTRRHVWLYALEALHSLSLRLRSRRLTRFVLSHTQERVLKTRGRLLSNALSQKALDLIVCENNYDVALTLERRIARLQILDLPSPLAEELYYGGQIATRQFRALSRFEARAYARSDYLSFHWHTYADFVRKNKYEGENFIDLGYGTTPKSRRASHGTPPRLVFLGSLDGYWVNLPLLEQLTSIYPHIDVYGGPPPPPHVRINYRGYADTLDILADYQFGLITISDDPLRRSSFSSKHLEYLSYGLPVFTPDWRHDGRLVGGTIPYNAMNFAELLRRFQDSARWEQISAEALATAGKLGWESALAPLGEILPPNS